VTEPTERLQRLDQELQGQVKAWRWAPVIQEAKPVFTRVFKEFGLPQRIRTDNGVPFATDTLGRLSQLSAWWVRLGILPEFIEPAKPHQNGRHEHMHRTLKAETSRPEPTCAPSNRSSPTSAQSSTMHVRTKHSTCVHPPPAMNPPPGRCLLNCHRSSTLTASRCTMSAPMGASGAIINGLMSHTSAPEPILALRKLTMVSGMCTSAP
jgi:hypothetical protein